MGGRGTDELRRGLERSACTLIRLGHSDVWRYPWSVWQAAVDEVEGDATGINR